MEQDRAGMEYQKINEFADLKGKTVLEIGCGNGRVSAMLVATAKNLVAIDPDEELIGAARSSVDGVDFRIGSGEALEFGDETFDIVAFTFSLHHQDCARALAEAYRVLKPGSQLLIIEPSVEGDVHKFFRAFRNEDVQMEEALDAIKNSRFKLERSDAFQIEWIFDDNEDVYSYYFKQYKMERNKDYITKMDLLLGEKINDRPLHLTEMITIFSLIKR